MSEFPWFDFRNWFKWIGGAASGVFASTWAAIAALAHALQADLSAGKQAAFAAGAATLSALATAAGNWISQYRGK
jgi:hypothetical protein